MIETHGTSPKSWSRRPHFSPRQKLSADQLNRALDDQLDRSALLMRALHGHGVVFGFEVSVNEGGKSLAVSCGMALDRHGRILFRDGGDVHVADLVGKLPRDEGDYTLMVHYAERRTRSGSGCRPCADEPDWVEQGVVFTLAPGCDDADRRCPDIPDDACVSLDDYVSVRTGSEHGAVAPAPDLAFACGQPGALCEMHCDWSFDPAAGLPLACVDVCDLIPDDADCPPRFGFCDQPPRNCGTRSHVYRTPLLHELIRNCHLDLAWIESLSWQEWIGGDWKNEVPWAAFAKLFDDDDAGFRVRFTKPISVATLNPGSIFLTAYKWENRSDYWTPELIPIDVEPIDPQDGFTREVKLVVYDDWIDAEVRGRRSSLFFGANIELTIRGQTLRDACGNMLDARLRGYSPDRQGQERPGGDFVATFRNGAKRDYPPPRSGGGKTEAQPAETAS